MTYMMMMPPLTQSSPVILYPSDGEGVDVFRGGAEDADVIGFFLTADRGKHDVKMRVLLDEILGIGGLLVRQNDAPAG